METIDLAIWLSNMGKQIFVHYSLAVIIFVVAGIALFIATTLDRKTGLRRARINNELITSRKKQDSTWKLNRYLYNLILSFFLDLLFIAVVWFVVDTFWHTSCFPFIPPMTMFSAWTNIRVEQMSMKENMSDGYSRDAARAHDELANLSKVALALYHSSPKALSDIMKLIEDDNKKKKDGKS